jgi:2',3'-cyclic-nucleotide 2'-phosphodiesterase
MNDQRPRLQLRILETTDIHANVMDYDYYKDAPAADLGLVRTASLVKQARDEVPNTLLVDNGDLIQGTPLGTYIAKIDPLMKLEDAVHPVYLAMNEMDYDIATFGNHEFNYGLEFLDRMIRGARFPYVNANIYVDESQDHREFGKNKYTPYMILNKKCRDTNGDVHELRIGVIGLVTPQIMEWDQAHLQGQVVTRDMTDTAMEFIPQMKKEGADIIIALAHTGFDSSDDGRQGAENAVLSLSKVPGIDAITFSHTHKVFPAVDFSRLDPKFKDKQGQPLPEVDDVKGKIHGVAAVQAGYGGGHLGGIDLFLVQHEGQWSVEDSQSWNRAVYDVEQRKALVDADAGIMARVQQAHEATVKYANGPIGMTSAPIFSYFALVQDDPSIQIVTNAQTWYTEKYIANSLPQYQELPILSVGSPFKAGRNGPSEYTDVEAGPIAIKSASDLYLYDNLLKAVKVKGEIVKEWLEMSAGIYHTIDPSRKEEQPLLNPLFSVYNFDVIDGITYQIDITQPPKYSPEGELLDKDASRILNLRYQGEPLNPDQEFIVVMNNYRAFGGGQFPRIQETELVLDSADENRQILMDYIIEQGQINPRADHNWSLAPIPNNQAVITFTTSPEAVKYLEAFPHIQFTGKLDAKGFGIFTLNL